MISLLLGVLYIAPCFASDSDYDIPAYGGAWAAVHRDNRNSNYAPFPVPLVYESDFETKQRGQRTYNHAVIGPRLEPNNDQYIYYTISGIINSQKGPTRSQLFLGKKTETGENILVFGPNRVDSYVPSATALVASDGSFFLADNEVVMRYSPTGDSLWSSSTPIAGIQVSGPQFTPDGRLLLYTWNGWIHVIEPQNGEVLWEENMTPDRVYPSEFPKACVATGNSGRCSYANTPSIDPNTNTIYQTFNNRYGDTSIHKYRYNTSTHEVVLIAKSKFLIGGSATSIVLSSDYQRLYLNDTAHHLMAYNVNDLDSPLWTLDIGYNPYGAPVVNPNGFIVPSGVYDDPDFKIKVIRDMGDYGEVVFEDNEYIPISSPVGGVDNRFVIIVCKKVGDGQKGALGLVVFDPNGIVSFTPWKDECLGAAVIPSLGEDGSVYVVGSGSVGLKKFRPVSP